MCRCMCLKMLFLLRIPQHILCLGNDGLFFAVKRMEVDPALLWTTQH